jgi:hypothetical protein
VEDKFFRFFVLRITTEPKIPGAIIPRSVFTQRGSLATHSRCYRKVRFASNTGQVAAPLRAGDGQAHVFCRLTQLGFASMAGPEASLYNGMETIVVRFACNEGLRLLLLCLILFLCQTKLSKGVELFDLSELNASQQTRLWTQVDNWAVAVVLASFCERPILLEERMLKIADRCVTARSINKLLDRFHAAMKKAEGNIWNCKDRDVQTFVDKTVAKADLLVSQAEEACRLGSIYHRLLPLIQ